MSAHEFRERYGRLASLAGTPAKTRPAPDVEELPAGARVEQTGYGETVVFSQTFTGPPVHEAIALLSALAKKPAGDVVYLDTETTGLAGGTGTFAFLVGLGRFSGSTFIVRQFFMRSPADELAMLAAIESELDDVATLVTYNGKTFDVPLLESRFTMARMTLSDSFEHLDLLHAARAIWKHRLADCSLSTIEQVVLGVERELDAPGWLIPTIYFDYLRGGSPTSLLPVIEHNRIDILSLARLTTLVLAYENEIAEPVDLIDRAAVALHRVRQRGIDPADPPSNPVWRDRRAPADLRRRLLVEISKQYKHFNLHENLTPEWQRGLADPSRAIREYCAVELAKYFEHKLGDHRQAHEVAMVALESARLFRDHQSVVEHQRRVDRLNRKLGKSTEGET